ncbi:hypothetical protein [Streptomyces sp. NPDC056165]|uniref:hypothetical protein n=1 Tax=Streptomyces sp. NPDC056165 TaxID=3345733 RepID=UPI0035DA11B1
MEKNDELMAVLLGEPSPEQAGDSADRYADAERDMAAVREQLRRIGDGLAQKAPEREESAPARSRQRGRRRLFALVASVAVALLGTGTAYLVAHNGTTNGESASAAKLTYEGIIACSSTVAEGTVERVEPAGGHDRYRIVLDVDRSYKPAGGERRLSFTDEGANVPAYYKTGVRMLVLVSSIPGEGPETYRAGDPPYGESPPGAARDALEEGRQSVERALPGARGLECSGAG